LGGKHRRVPRQCIGNRLADMHAATLFVVSTSRMRLRPESGP